MQVTYISFCPFCPSRMSPVQGCFRPGAPSSVTSQPWCQTDSRWHLIGFLHLAGSVSAAANLGHGSFFTTESFWHVSVSRGGLKLRVSALFRGENTSIYQRGYWFQTDRPCNLYFFVIYFLCHWVLIKWHPNSPLNWRDSLLSSEKLIKMLLLFLTALPYWNAARQCVISTVITF